jgi:hypothetical protein
MRAGTTKSSRLSVEENNLWSDVSILPISLEIQHTDLLTAAQIDRQVMGHLLLLRNKKVLVGKFLICGSFHFSIWFLTQ